MTTAVAASLDEKLIPVEELRKTLRDFGEANNFKGAVVIARALGFPFNKINRIFHDKRTKHVTGRTAREIETAIRHFNPRTNDETLVQGTALSKHVNAWLKQHELTMTAGAKIVGLPRPTFRNWARAPKESYRAGYIRPYLQAMQAYSLEEAKRLDILDKYNAKSTQNRGGINVRGKPKV